MQLKKHRPFILLSIVLLILIAIAVVRDHKRKTQLQEVKLAELPAGGDFKVQTNRGEFDSSQWRGKKVFLYFGFLNCPHICPLTRSNLQNMLKLLPEGERANAAVVFVSIDPKRDSLAELTKSFKSAPPNFYAGTGSDEQLKEITKKFGAGFSVTMTDGVPFVEHSSLIYVLNAKGEWAHALQYDSTPQELVAAFNNADTVGPVNKRFMQVRAPKLLGKNNSCDAGTEKCEVVVDGNKFTLKLSPSPVKTQAPLVIEAGTDSKTYTPKALDFEGTNLNMGYIRPSLEKSEGDLFKGSITLPVCELEKMKWKATLILTDSDGAEYAILFHFNTDK